jgi:hypothetical protein
VKVGFELEMSDIKTADAATIVYGDLLHWKDCYGEYCDKPTLTYDRFHVVSDGTLCNSDGTFCMVSYRDSEGNGQPADRSEGHPDHLKWKGAELISPVIDWESAADVANVFSRCEDDYFPKFKKVGAVCQADLNDGLHVHIDISALSWTEVRDLLLAIEPVQRQLGRLTSEWRGHEFFQAEEIASLRTAKTRDDFDTSYRTIRGSRGGLFLLPRWHDRIRRVVDIGPYLDPDRPDTIEFRCFRAAMDTAYIAECIELSLDVLRGCHRAGFQEEIETRVEKLLRKHRKHIFNAEFAGEVASGRLVPRFDELWRVTPDVEPKCSSIEDVLEEMRRNILEFQERSRRSTRLTGSSESPPP